MKDNCSRLELTGCGESYSQGARLTVVGTSVPRSSISENLFTEFTKDRRNGSPGTLRGRDPSAPTMVVVRHPAVPASERTTAGARTKPTTVAQPQTHRAIATSDADSARSVPNGSPRRTAL